jgi:hypothetical protein
MLQVPISLESKNSAKGLYATIILKDFDVLIQGTFNRDSKIINFGNKIPVSLQGKKGVLAIICYHNEELLFGLEEIILQKDLEPFVDFKRMEFATFDHNLREKLKSNF